MKLKRFCVHNFRNIVDSGWIEIEDMIALVGKNESGKTALLQALWKFNPFKEHPYSLDREWPRGRRKERSLEQLVVETEFEFNDEEKAKLAEIHESAASITGVRIIGRDSRVGSIDYWCPDQEELQGHVQLHIPADAAC